MVKKNLGEKFYITSKALLNIKKVLIINKTYFVMAAFNVDNKTFVMHVAIKMQEKCQFILKGRHI